MFFFKKSIQDQTAGDNFWRTTFGAQSQFPHHQQLGQFLDLNQTPFDPELATRIYFFQFASPPLASAASASGPSPPTSSPARPKSPRRRTRSSPAGEEPPPTSWPPARPRRRPRGPRPRPQHPDTWRQSQVSKKYLSLGISFLFGGIHFAFLF